MKKIILSTLLAVAPLTSAFAASDLGSLAGSYTLTDSKSENGGFCFRGITISASNSGTIDLYRNDIPEEPMYSAPLNGRRDYKITHGEALSSSSNTDTVTIQDGVLIFKTVSYVKTLGVPGAREVDAYALKAIDGKTLQAQRQNSSVGLLGIEKKGASCIYTRD